jgi:hypothetical protein
MDPIGGLRLTKEKLRLIEQERWTDGAEYSVTHYDAYQTCIAVSDLEAAKRHMGLTYAYRLLSEGPDSAEIPRNLSLYRSPGSHPATGMPDEGSCPVFVMDVAKKPSEVVGRGGKARPSSWSVKVATARSIATRIVRRSIGRGTRPLARLRDV